MRITSRRGTKVFFLCLGIGLVALAVALGTGWIILNWREGVLLFFGIIFFALIIAGMIVNTSFLVREIRRSEQHDSFINAVTHEQVLRAGRAGDKKAGRDKSEVDFRQLVRDCIEVARTRHHLQVEAVRYEEASTNGAGLRVLGSAEDLRTAVFNVLDNAIKYSGGNVDVRVRLETPDEKRIVLRVRDQGVGIPPDDVKQIFKRFYRVTHRSMAHVKGTGLGLFIVKSIAQKHGGKVFAESAGEGRGATITLELPRMEVPRSPA